MNSIQNSHFPELSGVVYMRKPYVNDSLDSTTLTALGLADQSAKFQLQYTSSGGIDPGACANNGGASSAIVVADAKVSDTSSLKLDKVKNDFIVADETTSLLRPHMEVDLVEVGCSVATISGAVDLVHLNVADNAKIQSSEPFVATHSELVVAELELSDLLNSSPLDETTVKSSCDKALKHIMHRNFDAATSAAVVIFLKYIDNIIRFPNNEKYSRISTGNKVFVDKIGRIQGKDLFFRSVGFIVVPKEENNEPTFYSLNPKLSHVYTPTYWLQVRMSLEAAGRDLGVNPELLHPPVLVPASHTAPPLVEFDPFKAILTRTTVVAKSEANFGSDGTEDRESAVAMITTTTVLGGGGRNGAGGRGGPSSSRGETDTILAGVEERRKNLEGDPSAVIRRTTVSRACIVLFFPFHVLNQLHFKTKIVFE